MGGTGNMDGEGGKCIWWCIWVEMVSDMYGVGDKAQFLKCVGWYKGRG